MAAWVLPLFRGALTVIRVWLSTFFLLARWALRLLRYLGLNAKWTLLMLRLVVFAALLLGPFLKMYAYYFRSDHVLRGVRYGPFRRNDFDVYAPHTQASFSSSFAGVLGAALSAREAGAGGGATAVADLAARAQRAMAVVPTLIFVPGGAWAIGHKTWGTALARSLSAAGMRVIAVDYRNFPQAKCSAMVADVDAAVAGVFGMLGRGGRGGGTGGGYVYLSGQSAGAHLGVCAVLERAVRRARPGGEEGTTPALRRFIGISGPYDLTSMMTAMAARGVGRGALHSLFEGDIARFSPAQYVQVLAALGSWEGGGDGTNSPTRPAPSPHTSGAGETEVSPPPVRLRIPAVGNTCCVRLHPHAHLRDEESSSWHPSRPPDTHLPSSPSPPRRGGLFTRVRRLTHDAADAAEEFLDVTSHTLLHPAGSARHTEAEEEEEEEGRPQSVLVGSPGPVEATAALSCVSGVGMQPGASSGMRGDTTTRPASLRRYPSTVGFDPSSPPPPSVVRGEGGDDDVTAGGVVHVGGGVGDIRPVPTAGQAIVRCLPPITLLHGAEDCTVDAAMSHAFAGALHACGVRCCEQWESHGAGGGSARCTHDLRVRIFPGATHTDAVLEGALSAGHPPEGGGTAWAWLWALLPWVGRAGSSSSSPPVGLRIGDALIHDVVETVVRDILADHGLLEVVLAHVEQSGGSVGGEEAQPSSSGQQTGVTRHPPLPPGVIDLSRAHALAPPLASVLLCSLARRLNPF